MWLAGFVAGKAGKGVVLLCECVCVHYGDAIGNTRHRKAWLGERLEMFGLITGLRTFKVYPGGVEIL